MFKGKGEPYRIFLIYSICTRSFMTLIFTVNMIYFVTVVGLNPLQMVLVGTFLESSIFLFEVPTGVVADTISRRLSVVIGVFFIRSRFFGTSYFPRFFIDPARTGFVGSWLYLYKRCITGVDYR